MSMWTDRPDESAAEGSFKIMRTPPGRPLEGIIVSDSLVGTKLHFWKGRSKPCEKQECEACFAGQIPRWKGYVLLKAITGSQIVIFEFTERGFGDFDAFHTQYGTLRGAKMKAHRLNKKANGPLQVTFGEGRVDEKLLPPDQDLRLILEKIWEVNTKIIKFHRESQHDQSLLRNGKIG